MEKRNRLRQYLTITAVAMAAALLFVPPRLPTEKARGGTAQSDIPRTPAELTVEIAKNLKTSSELSIAAKDLKTGERYSLGADKRFDAASTQKLTIVAYMYNQASNDRFDLDQVITIPSAEVQRYGTGSLQYERAPLRKSWRELARVMMKESDNTAAYVLTNRLDQQKVQEFANGLGLTSTDVFKNTTTATDMLVLIEAIYRDQVADPTLSQELKGFMVDTAFEDRLAPGLPDEATLIHKTGDAFDGGLHDVGVITYRDREYAVALFSRRVDLAEIPDISRELFEYYTR